MPPKKQDDEPITTADAPEPAQEPQEEAPEPARPIIQRLGSEAASLPAGKAKAVRCDMLAAGYFPQGDPRAGEFHPGRVYRVGEEITAQQAAALISGGGFTAVSQED